MDPAQDVKGPQKNVPQQNVPRLNGPPQDYPQRLLQAMRRRENDYQQNIPQQNIPQQNIPQQNITQQNVSQQNDPQQFRLQQIRLYQQAAQRYQAQQQQAQPQQAQPQQAQPQQNILQQNFPRKRPAEDSDANISVEQALEQLNKSYKRAKAPTEATSAKDNEIAELRRALQASADAVAAKDKELTDLRQTQQAVMDPGQQTPNDNSLQEQTWVAKEREWLERAGAMNATNTLRLTEITTLKAELAAKKNTLAVTQHLWREAVQKLDDYKSRMRQMGEE